MTATDAITTGLANQGLSSAVDTRLSRFLADALRANAVTIVERKPLSGGNIQDNQSLRVEVADGPLRGEHHWVLRGASSRGLFPSADRAREYNILCTAHSMGIRVPRPIVLGRDDSILGGTFFIASHRPGTAVASRVIRYARSGLGPTIAHDLAEMLAKLHRYPMDEERGLLALGPRPANPELAMVAFLRRWIDALSLERPALEWGLWFLRHNAPGRQRCAFCHRDYRTGNYLVDDNGLTAILDWEFAGWSDPIEDLGWFLAAPWNFGADDLPAGGVTTRQQFLDDYFEAGGEDVDPTVLRYWEIAANLRWALISVEQGRRYRESGTPDLELALIGRRLHEAEYDVMRLLEEKP